MKKPTIVLLTVLVFNFGCQKAPLNTVHESNCISAKILAEVCGTAIVQITDEKHKDLGEKVWKDPNGKELNHVFYTEFNCDDMQYLSGLGKATLVGLPIKINIVPEASRGSCAVCLALLAGRPNTQLHIKIVDECVAKSDVLTIFGKNFFGAKGQ
jgi:hypothetical protein